jgi:NADPH:quinone reductase-like Zn-dependent oxidoreductase
MVRVELCVFLVHAASASTMKAGALVKMPTDGQIHLEDLREVEVPVPEPAESQVLVKVAGSSVNPVDWKLIESDYAKQWQYPHVFGRDCAGTVVAVGAHVQRLKVGDAVWADNAAPEGCYAEFVALEESITSLAPSKVSLAEAAVLPLVALTAKQALNFGSLPGSEVGDIVVLGGSGGVGHVGLQISRAWAPNANVTTTCGGSHAAFCKEMGADQVVDYHTTQWQDVVPARSVDIVFDTVGLAGTGELAYDVLRDGGTFVTLLQSGLASDATAKARPSVQQHFFLTDSSDYQQLDVLADLVDSGKLKPIVDGTFQSSEIAACFNYSMSGHTVGKSSVVPSKSASAILV